MKDCKDCEFFEGYDYSEGTPRCSYSEDGNCNGYEYCPYNDCSQVKNKGLKIEIDAGFMHDYILHTMKNTIEGKAHSVATKEIKSLINQDLKENIIAETKTQIKSVVENQIAEFMSKDITVGGGWSEPERTITRQQYLAETVKNELEKKFKSDAIKYYATREVENAINVFERKLKDEINAKIKTTFNEITRQTLTDSVVQMLMCNDTYSRLAENMNKFIPDKTSN